MDLEESRRFIAVEHHLKGGLASWALSRLPFWRALAMSVGLGRHRESIVVRGSIVSRT